MPRARPSVALGLSLAVLNLVAAVLPPAAHAAAHLHDAEHHGATVGDHHHGAAGSYSQEDDGHLHLELQAVTTTARPDIGPPAEGEVGPVASDVPTAVSAVSITERRAHPVVRTHDPPSAPRAPPAH